MQLINATDVRKNWSETCDSVTRVRPSFIKRTRGALLLASREDVLSMLAAYTLTAKIIKDKKSVTLSLNELDLVENAASIEEAKLLLAESILDYAEEYYENYSLYSKSPNRGSHQPYIIKALLLGSVERIAEELICQAGEN